MSDEYIQNQLAKFDLSDIAINELNKQFSELKINGIEDKEGYRYVREARLTIKNYRVQVEKRRKELNEDALRHQKIINTEAKRITALLEPIEQRLAIEEKAHDEEIERIKLEEKRLLQERLKDRVQKLMSLAFRFDGIKYYCDYLRVTYTHHDLEIADNGIFKDQLQKIEVRYKDYVKEKLEAEEAARKLKEQQEAEIKAEREALALQRAEQEAIARQQAEEKAALEAEAERLRLLTNYIEPEEINLNNPLDLTKKQLSDLCEGKEIVLMPALEGKNIIIDNNSSKYIDTSKKEFAVQICGQFKASGTYFAFTEEEAKEIALSELHNTEFDYLTINFEQSDCEIY